MANNVQEPKFEVVDDTAQPRDSRAKQPRVMVVRGWKAALLAAPIIAAASVLLLTVAGLLAAGLVVGGTLLGAGLLTRKALFPSSSRKKELGDSSRFPAKR